MGFWETVASVAATLTTNSRLDQLCRENGWSIDERHGNAIGLHFNGDRITPQRTVYVLSGRCDTIMQFSCRSRAVFSGHDLPDELMAAMMVHNKNVSLGGWYADLEENTLTLVLEYMALGAGVNATSFKGICSSMIEEVAQIEANLQRKGLL
jgi:hypothetical protein